MTTWPARKGCARNRLCELLTSGAQLYVACSISRAIQYLTGMKNSKVIFVISKNPEASIFSVVDFGLEADQLAAVPELVQDVCFEAVIGYW